MGKHFPLIRSAIALPTLRKGLTRGATTQNIDIGVSRELQIADVSFEYVPVPNILCHFQFVSPQGGTCLLVAIDDRYIVEAGARYCDGEAASANAEFKRP